MADLLECVLQIKALGETPARVEELVRAAPAARWAVRPRPGTWAPVEVLAHLADAELFHGTRLRLMLTSGRAFLQPFEGAQLAERARYLGWAPQLAFARFAGRRGETLDLLSSCSAEDLARVGVHPVRGEMSVADLVALMLAHDTDHVGQMRERLGLAGGAGRSEREA